jgi:hypothetical protein
MKDLRGHLTRERDDLMFSDVLMRDRRITRTVGRQARER